MHTLRWLSAGRSVAIVRELAPIAAAWVSAWSVSALPDPVWHPDETPPSKRPTSGWFCISITAGALALRLDPGGDASLGRLLVDVHDDADSILAGRIGRAALRDLARRVLHLEEEAMSRARLETIDLPAALGQPSQGGGCFVLDLGSRRLRLAIDAALAECLAPPAPPPQTALVRRGQAVGEGRVRLQLRLDLGEMPLGQLQHLAVGEVIASRVPLDSAFGLAPPQGAILADAGLGRIGTHRAAVIKPTRPTPSGPTP